MNLLSMLTAPQVQRVQSPVSYALRAETLRMPSFGLGGLAGLAGLAGFGMAGLGGLAPLVRIAAPVAGGYLGWNYGADVLRNTRAGQAAVGWLNNTPVGGLLGADPYRPVGGALGALGGYALSKFLT